jgi:hypothetical protein
MQKSNEQITATLSMDMFNELKTTPPLVHRAELR